MQGIVAVVVYELLELLFGLTQVLRLMKPIKNRCTDVVNLLPHLTSDCSTGKSSTLFIIHLATHLFA